MPDTPFPPRITPLSFDAPLGRRIVELHVWAVGEGLRGSEAAALFDGLCRRLVAAGVPVWRAFAGMLTLHPQWSGYGYTWWRDRGIVEPQPFIRGMQYEESVLRWRARGIVEPQPFIRGTQREENRLNSPIGHLLREAAAATGEGDPWLHLRRRLAGPEAQCDFPLLEELAAAGATDYFAEIVGFGGGDASRGTGIAYTFATDRPEGFDDDDIVLLKAVLPVVSLAMMAHAGHTIASSLLAAYLGADAGGRVHAGAVERGSVTAIRAVLWYADIRSFTALADTMPGAAVIALLDEVFETLAAALRPRAAQILKFLGDGMLAIFPCEDATRERICRQALAAAAEAMDAVARMNAARCKAGEPEALVDLALHLGEVLYGNIGAVDRLDFTVIGPAVNEVARIETLCEPLGRKVLVSTELAAAIGADPRLQSLGRHNLRGVREAREIFGLIF
jgi:adenylate cyclase